MEIKTLLRFLILLACLLFVISVFSPFIQGLWHGFRITSINFDVGLETFWSYKESVATVNFDPGWNREELWLADYWSKVDRSAGPWVGTVLIFMLEAQVLTILFAVLAILKVKPYLLFLPILLNAFTVYCMWFVSDALSSHYIETVEIGFWLSLASASLFVSAFILSLKWLSKAKQQSLLQEKEERALLY